MPEETRAGWLASMAIAPIRVYQRLLSPWLGRNCRFHPTCSQYAIEALQTHGLIIGVGYALWRVLRCQPFCRGGNDPVPPGRSAPRRTWRLP